MPDQFHRPDLDPQLRPDARPTPRLMPRPFVVALAGITFLAAGCWGGDQAGPPDTTAKPPDTTAAQPPNEREAIRELNAGFAVNQAETVYQVFMVPGGRVNNRYVGGIYYDAPAASAAHHTIPDGEVLRIDMPRPLDDAEHKIHWWAFTLAPNEAQNTLNDPTTTYWLPLKFDPQLQPGAGQPDSMGWGMYRYEDGTCYEHRPIFEDSLGNSTLATGERTGVGTIVSRRDFNSQIVEDGLYVCDGNTDAPS